MDSAYAQLARTLRDRLAAGEWAVGDKFPAIIELQAEYDIRSLNTVRRAQAILVDEGLLRPEQGRGTYVVGLPQPPGPDPTATAVAAIDTAMRALAQARNALTGQGGAG
jgi:DNA-binding GntR family transcriptional regulator